MKTPHWELNASTGNHLLNIDDTGRIQRAAGGGLYRAMEWGDYSLSFPAYGPWRKTLASAKRDLVTIRKR